jgi:hypothetical protein
MLTIIVFIIVIKIIGKIMDRSEKKSGIYNPTKGVLNP